MIKSKTADFDLSTFYRLEKVRNSYFRISINQLTPLKP